MDLRSNSSNLRTPGSLKLVSLVQNLQSNINCWSQNSERRWHEPGFTRYGCVRVTMPNSRGCYHVVIDVKHCTLELSNAQPAQVFMGSRGRPSALPLCFSQVPFQASLVILLNIAFSKLVYGLSQASAHLPPPSGWCYLHLHWKPGLRHGNHINFSLPHPRMGLYLDTSFPVLPEKQELPALHSHSSFDAFSGLDPVTSRSLTCTRGPSSVHALLHWATGLWRQGHVPTWVMIPLSRTCSVYWGPHNHLPKWLSVLRAWHRADNQYILDDWEWWEHGKIGFNQTGGIGKAKKLARQPKQEG